MPFLIIALGAFDSVRDVAAGAKALWDEIRAEREDKGQSTSVTVARREIRKWLSESSEGRRVEELVGRLLG